MTEVGSSSSRPPNPSQEAPLSLHTDDSTETSKALPWVTYESLLSLPAESEIEKMKGSNGSLIMREFSPPLDSGYFSSPFGQLLFHSRTSYRPFFLCCRRPPRAIGHKEQSALKEAEYEVDHLEAALVREDSHLSSAHQELRRSATYAQQVAEVREDRAVALLAAQTGNVKVERLIGLVADLQSQRLSAGLPLSWINDGAIHTDFVLNFEEQILSLHSLLETYKKRFPRGKLEGIPPFLLPSSSKSLGDSE
ncbi:hypothetical protein LIER_20811 [Lithospermum erythrorhizon]|uniref:Uncharacterized protein n=1 Tax=Lithospermum erythrorhizon TaxID=34254 RepID=A0AAV3QNY5_LITER